MDTIVKTSSNDVHAISDPFLYNNLLTEDVPKLSIRRSNSMPTMMDWCYITTSLTHKQGLASPHRKKKSIEPLGSVSCHERMVSQEQEQQQEQEQEQEQEHQHQQHNLKQNHKQPRRKMPTPPSSTSTSMTEPESPFFGGLSRNIPQASNAQDDDDDSDCDRGVDVIRSSISDSPTATATIASQPMHAASTLGSSTIPSASSSTSIRTRLLSDLQQAGSSSQTTIRRSQSRRTTTTTSSMRADPGKQLRGLLFDLEQAGPYHPPTVPPNLPPPVAGNTYPAYHEHMRNISKIAAIARGGSSSSSSLRQSSFGIRSSRSPGGESNSNNPNLPLSSSFLRNYDSNTTAGEGATAPPLPSPSSNSRNTMSSAPYSPNISNTDPASSIVRLVSDRDVLYRTSATLSRSMNEIPSINRAKRTYSNVGVVVGEKREDELQQLATIDDSTLIDVRRNKIRTRNMMLNNNGPMIKTKSASASTISLKESETQHGGDQSNHNWVGIKRYRMFVD
jgi:hypothetical protein